MFSSESNLWVDLGSVLENIKTLNIYIYIAIDIMAIIITIINIITRGVFRAVGIYKRNNENKKTGTRLKKK